VMGSGLGQQTIDQLSRRVKEPAWLSELRAAAWQRHAQLPWPHPSDEIWRRTDVSVFDPSRPSVVPDAPALLQSVDLRDSTTASLIEPSGSESLLVWADGAWVRADAPDGVVVSDLPTAAKSRPEAIRPILEADGLTPQEQKFTTLNTAFHHDALVLQIPEGFLSERPIRLVRLVSVIPQQALFPLTVIVVGAGSSVSLIEEEIGIARTPGVAHTINGRIELVLEAGAAVRYCRIQRWDSGAHEFLLQRATLREGAQLDMVNINVGGRVSKNHVIVNLLGPQASSRVFGFVFGHDQQHVDFHSLQDHQAPHTFSDLLYKAALKDDSRMVYTGLIRIAKPAKQTDAYQANHNLLLSQRARAETIPMLEILADDVRCKHGATIGPVDEEQLFYLMTRGIPRALAERILVMGFVEPIIQQVPGEALQQRLREELEGSLNPVTSDQ